QRDRAFIIADVTFITAVPPEEVKIYTANVEKVGYYAGKVDTDNGILVQIEQYVLNRIVTQRPHPQALCPFLPQLDAFARHNRFNVLHPILSVLIGSSKLIALSLELPEETLVEKDNFDRPGPTTCMATPETAMSLNVLMADDDVKLSPLPHSPVLQSVGIERRCPDDEAPLSEMWRKERTTTYGRSKLKKGSEKDVEEEVMEDIAVKHYD
ncbi:hypothetical protein BU15DRAFT_57543, partial [Melanogaster broomeanus]